MLQPHLSTGVAAWPGTSVPSPRSARRSFHWNWVCQNPSCYFSDPLGAHPTEICYTPFFTTLFWSPKGNLSHGSSGSSWGWSELGSSPPDPAVPTKSLTVPIPSFSRKLSPEARQACPVMQSWPRALPTLPNRTGLEGTVSVFCPNALWFRGSSSLLS